MALLEEIYEQPKLLGEYLLFHYGTGAAILDPAFAAHIEGVTPALEFPKRCVERLVETSGQPETTRAYDLGCAVGRSTFELAHHAHEVTGIDLSAAFIGAANRLLTEGHLAIDVPIEGAVTRRIDIRPPSPPPEAAISFEVGDAVALAASLPPAGIVFAANLLCRLPTPERFLRSMAWLVEPGGQLILVTPFTWLEDFTPADAWPRDPTGSPLIGRDWIPMVLEEDFALEHAEDLPFLIREHARKFQWTIAHGMRWRRR